ncbi:unnamed protein product [Brachionus calyciflorus]|uniref:ATP-dependent DNA helicase n=1 Tax=Brachionus calyciflorus TaxID=104777 RepID=A0A814FGW3_9BILA|nr:unnamed protein product [Brachionus calyciflorus]
MSSSFSSKFKSFSKNGLIEADLVAQEEIISNLDNDTNDTEDDVESVKSDFDIDFMQQIEEYFKIVRSLNERQQHYVLNLLYKFKTKIKLPFYHFVSGGAGVGKNVLIKAIPESDKTF